MAVNQALLFHRLRWRLLRNSARQFARQSSMRPVSIFLCSLVVWLFVFFISLGGFGFLRNEIGVPIEGEIVGVLLDLLFLSLAVLLVFSDGLILYGSLFTAAETEFLLARPVADDQVFAYKYQGAIAFSSWAFLLLGGPILIAYGLSCHAPASFYALLPLFFLGFVLLPGSLGAVCALLIVNFVPRGRKLFLSALGLVLAVALGVWIYRMIQSSSSHVWQRQTREAVTRLLSYFSFTSSRFAPSHWISRGLQRAVRGDTGGSLYYLVLVWSNGLLLYLLAAWASVRLYRRGYNRLASGGATRRSKPNRNGEEAVLATIPEERGSEPWIDRVLQAALPFLQRSTRLLIVKDFRTFRRDPQQWGQVLAFSGLMLLYFANIRRFIETAEATYQNSISFLNLCAIALLLCTYTGRFIYPMLSLEGRKFWILGLLPVRREQLLWGKFAFSTTGGLIIAELLLLMSDLMLFMPVEAVLLHALTMAVLAAGLSGLSVGLGACMPNFRETDPSKIAAGFGGTLNLVAGLLFVLVVLALMAAPWHLRTMLLRAESNWSWLMTIGVGIGLLMGLAVGGAAVVLPLRAGIRALRRMEF